MRRNGGLWIATLVIGACTFAMCLPTLAEDWPAWRGNGDSIAREGSYPSDLEVVWKTKVPGLGYSSPIVVGDEIYVSTAAESKDRKAAQWIGLFVILGLTIPALAYCCGSVLRHPSQVADPHMFEEPPSLGKNALRQFGLVLIFVLTFYLALRAVAWAGMRYPAIQDRFGTGSHYTYSTNLFKGFPFSRYMWWLCGCVAAGAVFIINLLADVWAGKKNAPKETEGTEKAKAPSFLAKGFGFVEGLVVLGAVGGFFGMLLANTCMLLLGPHNHQNTLAEIAMISSLGAITAVGISTRSSKWRPFIAAISFILMAVIVGLMLIADHGPLADWLSGVKRRPIWPLYYAGTLVILLWFGLRGIQMRLRGGKPWDSNVLRYGVGPLLVIALGVVQYVATLKVVPNMAMVQQIICMDKKTGEIQWTSDCSKGPRGTMSHRNTAATSTPACDGEHIYAHFGDCSTHCLDMKGEVVWSIHPDIEPAHEGVAISPLVWKNLVYICYETDTESFTVAYDKLTGKEVWKDVRGWEGKEGLRDCYGTPLILKRPDGDQLVHVAGRFALGSDPATGKQLWWLDRPAAQIVVSPILANDLIVMPLDSEGGDCRLDALRLNGNAQEGFEPEVIWEQRKGAPGCACPVFYNGRLYSVTNKSVAASIDIDNGDLVWRERLKGGHYSSISAADGKIYLLSMGGQVVVMTAKDEAEVLCTLELGEQANASFALSDGLVYARGTHSLFALGEKKK